MITRCLVAFAFAGTLSCAGGPSPAEQVESGRAHYAEYCLECHTSGVGPTISREVLAAYRTPRQLFSYVRLAMPYETPGSLEEQQYWDMVAFLLADHDLREIDVALTPDTADEPF